MNATHAPGPWTHKATASLGPQYAVYADNDMTSKTLAIVYNHGDDAEANARLLAAAPELLAACQLAAVRLEGGNAKERAFNKGVSNALRDAIDKAQNG